ncbi:bifunctional folylpolyglutamate synthase/dihydrofolate synthase [Oceanobacillus sp. CAU 1775]
MFSTLHEVESFFNHRKKLGIKPGLERIEALLQEVNHPERKFKAIHIAGTNGKGSTLHFINAALRANNYEVGIFTSPSFTGLTGHILLNDTEISESTLVEILNNLHPKVLKLDEKGMAPTEFEILTVAAFMFFAERGDIVLIETGMGGRFDTTNTVHPLLTIITNISIDHTDFLGETLEEIAFHKAGIIKKNTPAIIGEMVPEALQVIKREAESTESELHVFGDSFTYEKSQNQDEIIWRSNSNEHKVKLQLQGEHQFKNISLALKALEVLENKGFNLSWENVLKKIAKLQLPGRFETIHNNPRIIVDAAHNSAGVQAFIETVKSYDASLEKHVIVAAFKDKDTMDMLKRLSNYFTSVTVTTFDHPRAASTDELIGSIAKDNIYQHSNWQYIMKEITKNKEKSYYITGSLHFITLVRNYFNENRLDM